MKDSFKPRKFPRNPIVLNEKPIEDKIT